MRLGASIIILYYYREWERRIGFTETFGSGLVLAKPDPLPYCYTREGGLMSAYNIIPFPGNLHHACVLLMESE